MKALRQQIGLSTGKVAKELDIAESTVRNWEKGRSSPRLEVSKMVQLCELYQVTIQELRDAVNESNRTTQV